MTIVIYIEGDCQYHLTMQPHYSTSEVAALADVSPRQLYRWLYAGKLSEPDRGRLGGITMRLWSETGSGGRQGSCGCLPQNSGPEGKKGKAVIFKATWRDNQTG